MVSNKLSTLHFPLCSLLTCLSSSYFDHSPEHVVRMSCRHQGHPSQTISMAVLQNSICDGVSTCYDAGLGSSQRKTTHSHPSKDCDLKAPKHLPRTEPSTQQRPLTSALYPPTTAHQQTRRKPHANFEHTQVLPRRHL